MASCWKRSSISLASALLLSLSACKSRATDDTAIPEEYPPESTEPPAASYESPPVSDVGAGAARPAAPAGSRTHVVRKGDTLYSLARQYYGDAAQWKRIFQANGDRIPNKDQIRIGQELAIPD
jgi:5'-nucleotidase / UDP-sugar diphosphatase